MSFKGGPLIKYGERNGSTCHSGTRGRRDAGPADERGAAARWPRLPLGYTLPLLVEADLTIVNLECVIASTSRPWSRWPKAFHFRADPRAIDALKRAGVDCVVLANNHVLDYEEPALLEMLELLERNGLAFAEAGRDLEEARRPAVLDARGVKVGVVAFTDDEPG